MSTSLLTRRLARIAFCILLLGMSCQAALAYEVAPIKVVVNTQDNGEYFVLLGTYGEIYLGVDDVAKLGLPAGETVVRLNGVSYVSLSAYRPKLNFKFDERDSVLMINADPSLFSKTVVDLAPQASRPNALGIDTAFLNYSIVQRDSTDGKNPSLDVPVEGVMNARGLVFRANYLYRQNNKDRSWMHTYTSVSKDFVKNSTRLMLGDFTANSGELGSGGVFGGINFGKAFSMSPALTTYPGVSVSGVLDTPSQVEIYLNNSLLSREKLPAGSFELTNVPSIYGGGEATVVIKDAFGRERRETLPVYISARLLNVGLHDFNYGLGLSRKSTFSSSMSYDRSPTFLGFHRVGLTRIFTGGMRFEAGDKLLNAGPTAELLLGQLGELEAGFAASKNALDEDGYAGYFRYSSSQTYTHFRFSIFSANGDYATLATNHGESRPHVLKNVSVGLHGSPLGGLSLSWNTVRRYGIVPKREISLLFSSRLGRRTSMFVRASRSFEGKKVDDLVWLSLNVSFDGQISSGASYTKEDEGYARNISLQKSTPTGQGYGFRLQAADDATLRESGEWIGDVNLQYKARPAAFSANYLKSSRLGYYDASMAGAVAFIDNSLFFTRPIRDSFSLVKIGNLDNVRVYFGSEVVGETYNGKLLLPSLTAYGRNTVAIEPQDVPIDFTLSHLQQVVSPTYRSGAVVKFGVTKFQGFTGHLFLREKGRRWSADFAGLVLTDKTGPVSSTVGRGGEFYFENLRPGKYVARATHERRRCEFVLTVPVTDSTVVELGEVNCEL